jgi:DNA topoisomerase VI subunit B
MSAASPQKVKPEQSDQRSQQAERSQVLLFSREDWSLYCSLATLSQKSGVPARELPWLVVKEFADNALDAADAAGRHGAVEISVDQGNLIVADQGVGIPDATPERIAGLFRVARPMLSSKLLRRPTRGAVGNGLRVCLGYLTSTRGKLIIETGSIRVELEPEVDGTSTITGTSTIEPRQGLCLTAVAGDALFTKEHLSWAEDAIELARQSGAPAFSGRPSPHWLDLDHFRVLLRSAVGNLSVRQFLGKLDGCTSSPKQTKIAARFLRRPAASLDAAEVAELLAAAQAETKPPKPQVLCPLGKNAVVSDGYAIAEGMFTEGEHEPRSQIPFLVECWVDAFTPDEEAEGQSALFMNRTRAVVPCTRPDAWHGRLEVSISGTRVFAPVPSGPRYSITVAITSPMFRLVSDGKAPDVGPFRTALTEAISKAAKEAGREIAADMSAQQKQAAARRQQQQQKEAQQLKIADRIRRQERRAQIEAKKAERRARPNIDEVVEELLPGAIKIEEASGLMFNTRRLLYRIRDEVYRRAGQELKQNYFDKMVTKLEAERGDLSQLLIREARGFFSIPHDGSATPLGTVNVRKFQRPPWRFNKIVVIEKEDLRLMLQQAGWDRRHDALLMSPKGFNTRASRDLIDKNAETSEPVKAYSVHDADAAGTVIQHTLQHATLARAARKVEIIDLGLQPWEGILLELPIETVPIKNTKDGKPIRRAVGAYVRERTDRAPTGETWEEWLQHSRIELNAFTSAELITWLDRKMEELGNGKLIPPDDVLRDEFHKHVRYRAEDAIEQAIEQRLDNQLTTIEEAKTEAARPQRQEMERLTAPLWELLGLLEAPFLERIALLEKPFDQEAEQARAEAAATDRDAEVDRVLEEITPDPDTLRTEVDEALRDRPTLRWTHVLQEIADATEVGYDDGEDAP